MMRLVLPAAIIILLPVLLVGQVPTSMSYQGYLTDNAGTPVPDNTYMLTFKLYTASAGGTAIWSETHPGVVVSGGLFNVVLGRGSPTNPLLLPFDREYYLGITQGANPEMTPRVRLTTSAYAFRAREADGVADGSIVTADIAPNAVTSDKVMPHIVSSINGVVNDGGNIDLVAGTNVTITPDVASNRITIASGGGGLTLPYAGSASSSSSVFEIQQNGNGRAFTAIAASGSAIDASNNNEDNPTIRAYNGGTSLEAPVLEIAGPLGTRLTIENDGGIITEGNISTARLVTNRKLNTGYPTVGALYPDNIVYAWARVHSGGTALSRFGCTVQKLGTGRYRVTYLEPFPSSTDAAPVVTAHYSSGPRIAMISMAANSYCEIEIYNLSGALIDSFFHVIVVGRY